MKSNARVFATATSFALLSFGLVAGCSEKPADQASSASPDAPATVAASPAPGTEMGPPAPPPETGGAPTPFKGDGKIISASGLKYEVMTVGKGPKPKNGQYVQVQYVGTGEDGNVFDSSYRHGNKPFEFKLGQGRVIKGWDTGVGLMTVGSRWKFTIPGPLAYGDAPPPGAPFKPNETLTFDIELLGATDNPVVGGE
jgi:hypothetical protein